jgi:ParB-like chromosome segregation protein Spo0J
MEITNTVELSELDLRYESLRIKYPKKEERLLLSILKNGIRTPLHGVQIGNIKYLLDGFKRIRCAKKLAITSVPYLSLGNDEAVGIIRLMRDSFTKEMNIIEQVKLIEVLKTTHGLSIAEIAVQLEKSKAWVSIRATMSRTLSTTVTKNILSGKFPARSYLYTILPFTRVNKIKSEEIDRFISRVAGNNLTTREIALLAREYFTGSAQMKKQIEKGQLQWGLEYLKKEQSTGTTLCLAPEHSLLECLEKVRSGMQKLSIQCGDLSLKSNHFLAQANVLTKSILNELEGFIPAIRSLYDRSR